MARAVALVAVIVLTGMSLSAQAVPPAEEEAILLQPRERQVMHYEVYAGGINAVQARLDVAYLEDQKYQLVLDAWTKGFLGKIVPWEGRFSTVGWDMGEDGKRPQLHRSRSVWRGDEEIKEYSYNKDRSFNHLSIVEEGKDKSPDDLDPELTQGTTDALSATLAVLENLPESGECSGEAEVFDGKRRFKLDFQHEQDVVLEQTRYNVYEGPAVECVVEVTPVSGAWHSKPRGWLSIQEQGRQKGSLPTVWMAQMEEDSPAVPVKIRVKTDYGTMFMHLVAYQNGDQEETAPVIQ